MHHIAIKKLLIGNASLNENILNRYLLQFNVQVKFLVFCSHVTLAETGVMDILKS
jgi:hypothetical protein